MLPLAAHLDSYLRRHPDEKITVLRFAELLKQGDRVYHRNHFDPGHVTGSAWVISPEGKRALLMHHKKLDKWLQPGGHSDGDPDTFGVALREALEETGIPNIVPAAFELFDIDIHQIPPHKDEPAHEHFDARFLLRAASDKYKLNEDEGNALRWVAFDEIKSLKTDDSVLRLADRWQAWRRNGERL